MSDADKLRDIAGVLSRFKEKFGIGGGEAPQNLLRIAFLLDAVPPETLEAIKAGTWIAVPKEPTSSMLAAGEASADIDYQDGTSQIHSRSCYVDMLAAAPRKPEKT